MPIPLQTSEFHTVVRCWGKTFNGLDDPEIFHPAVYHMLDVGNVVKALLEQTGATRWRNIIGETFGCPTDHLEEWLPFAVSLHDIGKISAEFQAIAPAQKERLQSEGFSFGRINQLNHAAVSQVCILYELDEYQLLNDLRTVLRDMAGGHHGIFSAPSNCRTNKALLLRDEPFEWKEIRKTAIHSLKSELGFELPENWNCPCHLSAAVMVMTGLTILCDWLGSDERFFPPEPGMELGAYHQVSLERARRAVQQTGFTQDCSSPTPAEFSTLYPSLTSPRPLQKAIDRVPASIIALPCLAIIEAPTGEGKTEAALALAHRIALQRGTDELYYALPTTATSNQMFGRVQRYVYENLGLSAQVKLVHSQAFLVEDDLRIIPSKNGPEDFSADLLEWFSPKKRALLSNFGVGTIDQAELGALNVRHNALRLAGLAGKVVILDEVHAYDTYMTTIIEQLLKWLAVLSTSVILLSATLPQNRRKSLIQAYAADTDASIDLSAYPGITIAGSGGIYHDTPPAAQPSRRINLEHFELTGDDPGLKAAWLLSAVQDGGCICWITNTVNRAQELFKALEEILPNDVKRLLIHSRFTIDDRQDLERELVNLYGPNGVRPHKGIVIGTQVLEQSLDLDFDLMVSDLAPVDLLLQRAGRLHRHDRSRPAGLETPTLWLYERHSSDGSLNLSVDKYVYAEYLLLKTYDALAGHAQIDLPSDYRTLIETVYTASPPDGDSRLAAAWLELQKKQQQDSDQAAQRLLPDPKADETFASAIANNNFEESEDRAGWMIAQTRLGERSLTLIPMQKLGLTVTCLGVDGEFNPDQPLPRHQQLSFLRRSIRISHHEVVAAIEELNKDHLPELFKNSPLLKNTFPLWLEDGLAIIQTHSGQFHLELNPILGLVINKG